jgi:hypothetical protein
MNKEPQKVSYTKEYRTLLEKLLEVHVRLEEVKGDKKLIAKLDPLIDKLISYFHKQVDRTIQIHEDLDARYKYDSNHH